MSFENFGLSPVIKHNLHGARISGSDTGPGESDTSRTRRPRRPRQRPDRNRQNRRVWPADDRTPLASRDRAPLKPRQPRALVLTPTRELALQVNESLRGFSRKTGLRTVAIFGGVGMQPQIDALDAASILWSRRPDGSSITWSNGMSICPRSKS